MGPTGEHRATVIEGDRRCPFPVLTYAFPPIFGHQYIFTEAIFSIVSKSVNEGVDGVRLTLTVHLPSDCPLEGYSGDITSSHREVDDETCHCQFVVRSEDGIEETHKRSSYDVSPDQRCICRVINDHGATPVLDRIEDGTLTLTAYLDRREDACELYQDVYSHFPEVDVERLATKRDEAVTSDRVSVDVSELTGKQREAVELAVVRGYYANPRGADLETLAGELDISRQALAHRLHSAEGKLLGQLFTDVHADLDCP